MAEMNCQELVELITAYLEDALGSDDRQRFEEHLASCDWCQAYVEQFRLTIAALGGLSVETLSPGAQRSLLDAFRSLPRA
jgi:anti-sigma factor RsiW